uniref:G patch domain-containing protein 11 n=2 Tax=Scophthalmus maximus TaxID=52904 RepID=A0A8D3ADV4_SCOMX
MNDDEYLRCRTEDCPIRNQFNNMQKMTLQYYKKYIKLRVRFFQSSRCTQNTQVLVNCFQEPQTCCVQCSYSECITERTKYQWSKTQTLDWTVAVVFYICFVSFHVVIMSDEEEDYMSDAFLSQIQDVKPGVSMVRRVKEAMKKETQHVEKNIKNRQKTYKEQEKESREVALQSSISNENKGFALLQKMGYKAGQGLGRQGAGRVDPIPLNIKTDRGGIGMEEVKKRKAEEELEHYRQKVRAKQQNETRTLEDFRSRVRTEREERKIEGDLRRSQRACEQLDSQKSITIPREDWYWPKADVDEEEDSNEEEEEEEEKEEEEEEIVELTSFDKLQILTSYLRGVHFYCIWCGTTYNDEEDLCSNCPGDTAADHE